MHHNFESYKIINPTTKNNFIILCDHASYKIPPKYSNLGLKENQITKHIGWDIGALEVSKIISKKLNATLIHSLYSRLLVDCNRSLNSKTAFIKKSEDIVIPKNRYLKKSEKIYRANNFYFPYQNAIESNIKKKIDKNLIPCLISIHSFTPVYLGKKRKWHIGILQGKDKRLSSIFIEELLKIKTITLGVNQPYKLDKIGDYTLPYYYAKFGVPHVLIEIRQDLLVKKNDIIKYAKLISEILKKHKNNKTINSLDKQSYNITNYYDKKNNL